MNEVRVSRAKRALVGGVVAGLVAGGLGLVAGTGPAAAIASATALPTVQVDGVVWSQVIVGNRVYATGMFSNARPAGAAAGTSLTPRSNILAYDLTTGALISSWAPSLNAQGLGIAASADGSRIYVGGDFTAVDGVTRNRLVALDATTGAVVAAFRPGVNGSVRSLQVVGDVVYAGGLFTSTGGVARGRLAAFSASNGALLNWAPVANLGVRAVLALPAQNSVVVGGSFTTVNAVPNPGTAAVDATTGAALAWPANRVVVNGGSANEGISSLSTDGSRVYATGFRFGNNLYLAGHLEGSYAADPSGNLLWVNGCRGDQYSVYSDGNDIYEVGHAHDCSYLGGFPNSSTYHRAISFTTTAQTTNRGGEFNGQPAPRLTSWQPTLNAGAITGQEQGPWHITGNGQYLVLGGEFTAVNGVQQQGLVRFAISAPGQNTVVGQDSFSRNATGTWGRADLGGGWTGGSAATDVVDGSGRIIVPAAGSTKMRLAASSETAVDTVQRVWLESLPTGGGIYLAPVVRNTTAGEYRAKVRILATGVVSVSLVSVVAGAETEIAAPTTIAGLTYTAGTRLAVRLQATGINPTTVQAKVWLDGTDQPTDWQRSVTDSTPALQAPGAVGVWTYLSASAAAPVVVRADDLVVTRLG